MLYEKRGSRTDGLEPDAPSHHHRSSGHQGDEAMAKPKLRTIHIEDLDKFQLDEEGRLYWHDAQVRLLSHVELPNWTKWFGILAADATAVSAAMEVIRLYKGMRGTP
jgi:hypothetical protein